MHAVKGLEAADVETLRQTRKRVEAERQRMEKMVAEALVSDRGMMEAFVEARRERHRAMKRAQLRLETSRRETQQFEAVIEAVEQAIVDLKRDIEAMQVQLRAVRAEHSVEEMEQRITGADMGIAQLVLERQRLEHLEQPAQTGAKRDRIAVLRSTMNTMIASAAQTELYAALILTANRVQVQSLAADTPLYQLNSNDWGRVLGPAVQGLKKIIVSLLQGNQLQKIQEGYRVTKRRMNAMMRVEQEIEQALDGVVTLLEALTVVSPTVAEHMFRCTLNAVEDEVKAFLDGVLVIDDCETFAFQSVERYCSSWQQKVSSLGRQHTNVAIGFLNDLDQSYWDERVAAWTGKSKDCDRHHQFEVCGTSNQYIRRDDRERSLSSSFEKENQCKYSVAAVQAVTIMYTALDEIRDAVENQEHGIHARHAQATLERLYEIPVEFLSALTATFTTELAHVPQVGALFLGDCRFLVYHVDQLQPLSTDSSERVLLPASTKEALLLQGNNVMEQCLLAQRDELDEVIHGFDGMQADVAVLINTCLILQRSMEKLSRDWRVCLPMIVTSTV